MKDRELPDKVRAPVVAHEDGILLAQFIEHAHEIAAQRDHVIRLDLNGGRAPAEPAQVGRHDAEARLEERGHLPAPGVAELGKPVTQDDERPLALVQRLELDPVDG